jgi:hypothetical protein
MNFDGKYIATWMTPHEVFDGIFGFSDDDRTALRSVMIGGRIIGESPSGLWVQIESVTDDKTKKEIMPSIAMAKPTQLLRWSMIENARIFDEKPTQATIFGFHPR